MKYLYLILISIGSTSLCGQDYFSEILPTSDSPLIKILKKIDNKYLMPVDFFPPDGDVKGGFLIFEKNETKKIKFDKIDLGAAPIEILENWIVLAGENPLHDGDSVN